jgi:hypothetical protein
MRAPSRTPTFWGLGWTLTENYIIELPKRKEGVGAFPSLLMELQQSPCSPGGAPGVWPPKTVSMKGFTPGVSKDLFHDVFKDQESRHVRDGAGADCAVEIQTSTCMRVISGCGDLVPSLEAGEPKKRDCRRTEEENSRSCTEGNRRDASPRVARRCASS